MSIERTAHPIENDHDLRIVGVRDGRSDQTGEAPLGHDEPDGGTGPAFGAACLMHQRYLSLQSQRLSDAEEES